MSSQEYYWAGLLVLDFLFACWFVSALCWAAARKVETEPEEIPVPGFSVAPKKLGYRITADHSILPGVSEYTTDINRAFNRVRYLQDEGFDNAQFRDELNGD